MGERNEMLGQRAELKPKRLRIQTECAALRDRLRILLPIHEEVDALNGGDILTTAIALKTSLDELAGLNKKIGILNTFLGEE